MTPKELIIQAWFLYKKTTYLNFKYRHSAEREAELNHLAERAHARYRRQLEA